MEENLKDNLYLEGVKKNPVEILLKREYALVELINELDNIHKSRSWRFLLKGVYLKKYISIWIKKTISLFILLFLFALSALTILYLALLKKIRGTIIFPGN